MRYHCDVCSKDFSVKRSLIRHVDSRHKKLKVFCAECNKPFSRPDSLAHHINTMHSAKPEKKRRQRKTGKVMREQVRVKRERRLPPQEVLPSLPFVNDMCDIGELVTSPVKTRSAGRTSPHTLVDFHSEDQPEIRIKPEVHMEVEPCIEIEGEDGFAESAQSVAHAEGSYGTKPLLEKQMRFSAADELDFTVLDMMQQSAIDAKDEDRMFLLSILSDFKRVPVEKKLKVKARIVGAIVDALD